jgi:hypothetical protein
MAYRLVIPRDLTQSQIRAGLSRSKKEAHQLSSKEFVHIPEHHDDGLTYHGKIKNVAVHHEGIIDEEQCDDEMTVMKPKVEHHRIHQLHEAGHSKKHMMNLLHKEKMGHVPIKH